MIEELEKAETVTNSRCAMCQKRYSVEFLVPHDVWERAIHPDWYKSRICLNCFIQEADAKLIQWDESITFKPFSLITNIKTSIKNLKDE